MTARCPASFVSFLQCCRSPGGTLCMHHASSSGLILPISSPVSDVPRAVFSYRCPKAHCGAVAHQLAHPRAPNGKHLLESWGTQHRPCKGVSMCTHCLHPHFHLVGIASNNNQLGSSSYYMRVRPFASPGLHGMKGNCSRLHLCRLLLK